MFGGFNFVACWILATWEPFTSIPAGAFGTRPAVRESGCIRTILAVSASGSSQAFTWTSVGRWKVYLPLKKTQLFNFLGHMGYMSVKD